MGAVLLFGNTCKRDALIYSSFDLLVHAKPDMMGV